MWIKYFFAALIFFALGLVTKSFFPQFWMHADIIFILFFVIIFLQKHDASLAVFSAFIAGFTQDIFSVPSGWLNFGVHITSLVLTYILLRCMFYFLQDTGGVNFFVRFIMLFSLCQLFYITVSRLLLAHWGTVNIMRDMMLPLAYSLATAIVVLYLYKKFEFLVLNKRQLNLFS